MKKFLPLILLALFCATQSNAFAILSVAEGRALVDPRVIADTANGATANFLIILRSQVNTRARVANIVDRNARGVAAFDALRATANATQPALIAQLDALGVKYRAYWIVNVIAAEGDRAVVDAIAQRADVLAIESNRAFHVELPKPEAILETRSPRAVEWNVTKINAPAVWTNGFSGQNIIYANADTGIQWDHPALVPHYAGWNGVSANHNYAWWDAIHSDISGNGTNPCGFNTLAPCDDHGHGTHTTGTGVGDDGAGNQIGVAPGAKWIGCRNMEQGWGTPSTYIECFQFFLAPTDLTGANPDPSRRPDVVGNSYGCPPVEGCSANSLLAAMDNLRAAGIFMAVSAGNAGPSCSSINDPPAIYDSAITVGSTDVNDAIASSSSRGPVTIDLSNRRKPDLVAPGVSVRSSYPGNFYASMSGTSMASPHVAGAVALLWSAYPCLKRNVDATEMILQQTALHLTTTQGCGGDSSSAVPNNVFGFGRIDTSAAFNNAPALADVSCHYILPQIFNNP
jgi:subtilisin family serine protease